MTVKLAGTPAEWGGYDRLVTLLPTTAVITCPQIYINIVK
jgi:hypothetical protein